LVLLLGFIKNVWGYIASHGLYGVYCGGLDEEKDNHLFWWINLYYLSKYYEFLDTIFLVLQGKNISFLHVWHHATVGIITFHALWTQTIFSWITCLNNCWVHVPMYFYFAESTRRKKIWWKKYLTTAQITQFIVDCSTSLFFLYFYLSEVPCRGSITLFFTGNFVGGSYLVLFILLYLQNYGNKEE